ncbi:MAG: hypothetical protein GX288_02645 [Clostridiales bacterium]|nr:hypothetical protein [Clostridiales bacterium]
MVDLKVLSKRDLSNRMCNYIERVENLKNIIIDLLNNYDPKNIDKIRDEYRNLKNEIKEEANYLGKEKNKIVDISEVHNCYYWSIMEASAYGFNSRINSTIDQRLYFSVEEVYYKLTKYYDAIEWKNHTM